MKKIDMEIVSQGKIRLNDAFVTLEHDDIICITIDCKSKYPNFGGTISSHPGNHPEIIRIDPEDESLHLDDKSPFYSTEIQFPRLSDFTLHSYQTGRYNVDLCFIHKGVPQ